MRHFSRPVDTDARERLNLLQHRIVVICLPNLFKHMQIEDDVELRGDVVMQF